MQKGALACTPWVPQKKVVAARHGLITAGAQQGIAMLVPSEYPASVLSTLHTHEAAQHARPCVQVARMLLEQDRNNAKVKSDPSAQVKIRRHVASHLALEQLKGRVKADEPGHGLVLDVHVDERHHGLVFLLQRGVALLGHDRSRPSEIKMLK